jgi:alpha-beta hydrolase superfamily lysophospholipase
MCSVTVGFLKIRIRWAGLLQVLLVATLLSTSGCAWLDLRQRQIIYRPTLGIPADFAGLRAGDERYFVNVPPAPHGTASSHPVATDADSAAQRVEMWWLPHPDKNAPTLLYFHGTFRTLYQNLHKIEALREAGFAVLAVEYRGWGRSTPITPSEQTILADADVAWAELQRREPRANRRVLYGHSMGSGVAVDVASRLHAKSDYAALILESAISSFADVAREAGLFTRFVAQFNNERFASIDKIGRVHAPLLMIHGSLDTTIPLRVGKKLFAAANPPKQWLTIEGGDHSDLDELGHAQYQAALRGFLNAYLSGS